MGEKNIKNKNVKKKKKTEIASFTATAAPSQPVVQPELIKKKKKPM